MPQGVYKRKEMDKERFLSLLLKKPSGCWEWSRCLNKVGGYGKVTLNKKADYAHRLSYKLFKGPIPPGKEVLHSCDNPPCCKPKHLFLGTQRQNLKDMLEKGRWKPARGEQCGQAVLTERQIIRIRQYFNKHKPLPRTRAMGILQRYLAKRFKVSLSNIRSITYGKTWREAL